MYNSLYQARSVPGFWGCFKHREGVSLPTTSKNARPSIAEQRLSRAGCGWQGLRPASECN
jgi:hypothetical protein